MSSYDPYRERPKSPPPPADRAPVDEPRPDVRKVSQEITNLVKPAFPVNAFMPFETLAANAKARDIKATAAPQGSVAALIAVEQSQIGYNGNGTEDNPATKYGAWNGYNGPGDQNAQWCLMFQNWCFDQAGIPIIPQPGWAGLGRGALGVVDGYNAYKNSGKFRPTSANPQPGDLVFFQYPGNSVPDHVGMVESYDANSRLITSIQGNTTDAGIGRTGNCCRRKVHDRTSVVGFGVPTFGPVVQPDPLEDLMALFDNKADFEAFMSNVAANAFHATLKSDSVVGAAAYGKNFRAAVNDTVAALLPLYEAPSDPTPPPPPPPVVVKVKPAPDLVNVVGDQVDVAAPTVSGGTDPYTWQVTPVPDGLTFANGEFKGTLTTAATYNVVMTATDANGVSGSDTFKWTVSPAPVTPPDPPVDPSAPVTQEDFAAFQDYVKTSLESVTNVLTDHMDNVVYSGLARAEFNGKTAPDHVKASISYGNAQIDAIAAQLATLIDSLKSAGVKGL